MALETRSRIIACVQFCFGGCQNRQRYEAASAENIYEKRIYVQITKS